MPYSAFSVRGPKTDILIGSPEGTLNIRVFQKGTLPLEQSNSEYCTLFLPKY